MTAPTNQATPPRASQEEKAACTPPACTPDSVKTVLEAAPAASDEVGGPKGPEPTRFGDWERKGRCVDF